MTAQYRQSITTYSIFVLTLLLSTLAGADIFYVVPGGAGTGDGSSWTNAEDSIQDAVVAATSGDEVWVAAGTYTATTAPVVTMKEGVAIYGGFAGTEITRNARDWQSNLTSIDGQSTRCCVHGADNATLDGFTITNGYGTTDGGGMYNNSSSPTVTNCTFTGNSAYYGGGMHSRSSTPTVTNCTFSENKATQNGGAMFNSSSSPTVTDCTFTENEATQNGGAMYNTSSLPTVENCTFTGNSANTRGGGMANYNSSTPTVTNCTFSGNSAAYFGGGMANYNSSSPTVTNCTFKENEATQNGGGMYNNSASPTVTNCTFSENKATNSGAMYNYNSSPTVENCTFSENKATNSGAMSNYNSATTLTNCTFIKNTARESGGAMYNTSSATLTNCTFKENGAFIGAGIFNYNSSPTLINCTFTGNSADREGGSMYNDFSFPVVSNSTFTGNSANNAGGAIYNITFASPTLINCTFTGNSANNAGGAMANYSSSSPTLTNCILWENTGGEIHNDSATATVTYSCIQGGHSGTGNISETPLFVDGTDDGDGWDLRLQTGSPCIDAGTTTDAPTADIINIARPQGSGIDMGAYEYPGTPSSIDQGDGPLSVTMSEDGAPTPWTAPTLSFTDRIGNTAIWSLSTAPSHGTAVVSGTDSTLQVCTYTPNANYNGTDSFDIQVLDSAGYSDSITIEVTVESVEDAPMIDQTGPLEVTMSEDGDPTPWSAPTLSATDGDDDTLTWSLLIPPSHGSATISGTGASPETFTYSPNANYNGYDFFEIEVSDGNDTDTIICRVTVEPVEDSDDSDGDGLTYDEEIEAGTDPDNPDSDGDGVNDGDEIEAGTDPIGPLTVTISGPDTIEVTQGSSHNFTAMVTGGQSGIHYQWYFQPETEAGTKAYTAVGDADACVLFLSDIVKGEAGSYRCKVWTTTDTAWSQPVQLTVTPGVPAANGTSLTALILLLSLGALLTLRRRNAHT